MPLDSSRGRGMTGGKGVGYRGADFAEHGLDVGGGEVVSGGVGDGAQFGFHRAWMGASGLAERLADPFGEGDTLESGEVLDFSVFRVVQEDL